MRTYIYAPPAGKGCAHVYGLTRIGGLLLLLNKNKYFNFVVRIQKQYIFNHLEGRLLRKHIQNRYCATQLLYNRRKESGSKQSNLADYFCGARPLNVMMYSRSPGGAYNVSCWDTAVTALSAYTGKVVKDRHELQPSHMV